VLRSVLIVYGYKAAYRDKEVVIVFVRFSCAPFQSAYALMTHCCAAKTELAGSRKDVHNALAHRCAIRWLLSATLN
jgi:hypothetical protein